MSTGPTIVWFRQDLRLADNPALLRAAESGRVVPVYVWSPEEEGDWAPGGAGKWWLHRSLESLDASLRELGSRLVLRRGGSLEQLRAVAKETGAERVFWNRRYEPQAIERDKRIKASLDEDGLGVESFNAALLHEPWTVATQQGQPYKVFTPYWRTCLKQDVRREPLPKPKTLDAPGSWPEGVELDSLELNPKIPWDGGLAETWDVGEAAAMKRLKAFTKRGMADYGDERNRMDHEGVSMLSPYLHWGELSPRQAFAAADKLREKDPDTAEGVKVFLSEIGWREFSYHLMYHFPTVVDQPLREEFSRFEWDDDREALRRWQRGQTGFPVVDAAMRQLYYTGWMHNRARMVVASFLTKDLLIPWQRGAEWFWDTLVDADLASNTQGWQWTAGCGADASPFFRVFNPVSQAEKFDPQGDYIRRWVPELAGLDRPHIFQPHEAPPVVLQAAGVELGLDYPLPMVDHGEARRRALEVYGKMRG